MPASSGRAAIVADKAQLEKAFVLLAQPVAAQRFIAEFGLGGRTEGLTQRIGYGKGERLSEVLRWACFGGADETYLARALEHVRRQRQDVTAEHVFTSSGTLTLPICPSSSEPTDRREIQIKEGDPNWIWYYYKRLGREITRRWTFERPPDDRDSPKGSNSPYFKEVFAALNRDQNPDALHPGKVTLPLRPDGQSASLPIDATEGYKPITFLQNDQGNCTSSQDDELKYPFDVNALMRVLAANAEENVKPKAVRLIIVDSGLFGAERKGSVFRGETLFLNNVPTSGIRGNSLELVKPRLPNRNDAAHGTWVASAALGGPLFAQMQTLMRGPLIQIDVYRLHEALTNGSIIISAEAFKKLFESLARTPIERTIVNLSLRTSRELVSVRERLGSDKQFLFVVAAGNGVDGEGQLLNADEGDRYPAVYGGARNKGSANLITVVALYRDKNAWQRAPFSDFGSRFVEIGAPGCAVPVLDYDVEEETWSTKYVDGTSFAAPLVSFTAALIAAELPIATIPEVKQRILAASDLNPHLVNEIADGRTLNIPKAVAVHHDVIDLEGDWMIGTATLYRNTGSALEWDQDLTVTCISGEHKIKMRRLLKVVPSFNSKANSPVGALYPDRLYASLGDDDQLDTLDCSLPAEVQVHFSKHGGRGSLVLRWDEINELTLRMPKVR
jgi:hypothetical protein